MTGDRPSPEFERIMSSRVGDADLTVLDVYKIGEAVLNWTATTDILGHAAPGNTLDYLSHSGSMWTDVVRDFVAWTSGRQPLVPECDDRLRRFIRETGWARHALTAAAGPPAPSP